MAVLVPEIRFTEWRDYHGSDRLFVRTCHRMRTRVVLPVIGAARASSRGSIKWSTGLRAAYCPCACVFLFADS